MAEIPVPAIQTRGLTRDFGAGRGLFDLNLEVQPGEAFGYLGPNAAGKSTTLRLLMGLLRPTSGSALVFGVDVTRDPVRVKRMVGYLPGELAQFGNMRGGQVLSLLAGLRGGVSNAYIRALSERLSLDLAGRYRDYSRGNKQKLAVVAALMAKPRLLILDEPTSGLDPIMQQEFYRLIAEAREAGTTVFMSSHVFAEVEHTCTRVGIIRAGRLVRDGGLHEIDSMRVHGVTISFEGELDENQLNGVEGVSQARIRDGLLSCQVQGDFDPLLHAISGVRVTNLVSAEPSLEEVFLTYYAGDDRPEPGPRPQPAVEALSQAEPRVAAESIDVSAPVGEPQPPVPFEAEAEPLPAGETVYFGMDPAQTPGGEPAMEPAVEPAPSPLPATYPQVVAESTRLKSTFELRDWLASELDTEAEPDEGGEAADSEAGLEQLAWTDPGPGARPPTQPETTDAAAQEAGAQEAAAEESAADSPPSPGPSLFDHDPELESDRWGAGDEPFADR